MKLNEHIPPLGEEASDSDGQETRMDDALLLLHLSDGGRQRASEEQLSTSFDVTRRFRMEVIICQTIVPFVKMGKSTDTFLDGR